MAERLKEIKRHTAIAKLNNVPTSPRKMRLVADMVRGVEVNRALDILHYSKKEASVRLEKLVRSAIANWEAKNEDSRKELENGNVYVQTIMVDGGRQLKRIRTAPQGRAARIRKRSNHITVIVGTKNTAIAPDDEDYDGNDDIEREHPPRQPPRTVDDDFKFTLLVADGTVGTHSLDMQGVVATAQVAELHTVEHEVRCTANHERWCNRG